MTPNSIGIRIPTWLSGIIVTTLLGLIIGLWQATDAKATRAETRITETEHKLAVYEERLKNILAAVTETRAEVWEIKELLISMIENPVPVSKRGGR